jgi:hypothetical protein
MSVDADGPWDLHVAGWEVLTVIFGFPIDIVAYGDDGNHCTVRLAGAFTLAERNGVVHALDAEADSWEDLTSVLALRRDKLVSVHATGDARLAVSFDSGRTITAGPDDRPYEHWEVTTPDVKLIALPGNSSDGVAAWSTG